MQWSFKEQLRGKRRKPIIQTNHLSCFSILQLLFEDISQEYVECKRYLSVKGKTEGRGAPLFLTAFFQPPKPHSTRSFSCRTSACSRPPTSNEFSIRSRSRLEPFHKSKDTTGLTCTAQRGIAYFGGKCRTNTQLAMLMGFKTE